MSGSEINLRVTGQSSQGGRRYMEDCFVVAYQHTEDKKDLEYAFFGIFDGHGGKEAAHYAKNNLLDNIVSLKHFWQDDDDLVLSAIRDGFLNTHMEMWKEVDNWPRTATGLPSTAGTTASVAFIRKGKLYTGHVGDSRIIIGLKEQGSEEWLAESLTIDHKPESPEEKQRIIESGGLVMNKSGVERVVWKRPRPGHEGPIMENTDVEEIPFLAVARSLGDLWSFDFCNQEFAVSPEPDLGVMSLDLTKDKCLILASDGVWNIMTPESAVHLVQDVEKENKKLIAKFGISENIHLTLCNPSKVLVDCSLERWNQLRTRADNVSVIAVMLDQTKSSSSDVLREQLVLKMDYPRSLNVWDVGLRGSRSCPDINGEEPDSGQRTAEECIVSNELGHLRLISRSTSEQINRSAPGTSSLIRKNLSNECPSSCSVSNGTDCTDVPDNASLPGCSGVKNADLPDYSKLTSATDLPGCSKLMNSVKNADLPCCSKLMNSVNNTDLPGCSKFASSINTNLPGCSKLMTGVNNADIPGCSKLTSGVNNTDLPSCSKFASSNNTNLPGCSLFTSGMNDRDLPGCSKYKNSVENTNLPSCSEYKAEDRDSLRTEAKNLVPECEETESKIPNQFPKNESFDLEDDAKKEHSSSLSKCKTTKFLHDDKSFSCSKASTSSSHFEETDVLDSNLLPKQRSNEEYEKLESPQASEEPEECLDPTANENSSADLDESDMDQDSVSCAIPRWSQSASGRTSLSKLATWSQLVSHRRMSDPFPHPEQLGHEESSNSLSDSEKHFGNSKSNCERPSINPCSESQKEEYCDDLCSMSQKEKCSDDSSVSQKEDKCSDSRSVARKEQYSGQSCSMSQKEQYSDDSRSMSEKDQHSDDSCSITSTEQSPDVTSSMTIERDSCPLPDYNQSSEISSSNQDQATDNCKLGCNSQCSVGAVSSEGAFEMPSKSYSSSVSHQDFKMSMNQLCSLKQAIKRKYPGTEISRSFIGSHGNEEEASSQKRKIDFDAGFSSD